MIQHEIQWAVIGAGAAGILMIGKLLEEGVSGDRILWIDPFFDAGDIGRYWSEVPSNTTIQRFLEYFEAYRSFQYERVPLEIDLKAMPKTKTCSLGVVGENLRWLTRHLKDQVCIYQGKVERLFEEAGVWRLCLSSKDFISEKVVMAVGSEPNELKANELTCVTQSVDLREALQPSRIADFFSPSDVVAVYGGSHSSVLVVKNLLEYGCEVVNVIRSPYKYAVNCGDWILYDNTGLKGEAASWAKIHLHGCSSDICPKLTISFLEHAQTAVKKCQKSVAAIGFSARHLKPYIKYDPCMGIIARGLFGLGVAYPEEITTPLGQKEWNVGLAKFVRYLNKSYPFWVRY